MLPILLGIAAALLLLVNTVQYRTARSKSRDLAYIHSKLNEIIDSRSSEPILLHTGNPEMRTLLTDLNRLLGENRIITANYTRTERSIKKMLTNMSHDLKTPLTVVLGLTETIAGDQTMTEAEKARLSAKIHDKAQKMLLLMNKFFDLARLESGDRELPLSKLNMNEVCKNNVLFFYESIVTPGYEAVIEIPETSVYAMGNPEAMDRILNNLISNAIRYGGEGKLIGLALRYDDEHIYIDVWDRGKGIGERHQELIFERLYTLEDSRNHQYQGSGLGLTITKRLVELLGGTIALSSIPYEKTIFTVRFPRIRY